MEQTKATIRVSQPTDVIVATQERIVSVLGPAHVREAAVVAIYQRLLAVNINAAKGLQEVLKTNLGPKGTMKM